MLLRYLRTLTGRFFSIFYAPSSLNDKQAFYLFIAHHSTKHDNAIFIHNSLKTELG